jgi:flagellar basal-body rod protein FlgB
MEATRFKLFDGMYTGLEQVLDLRSRQHTLTAVNLANADTPGFRAREINFENLLQDVMEQAMDGEKLQEDAIPIQEIEAPPWVRDGNSVNAERESAKLASNSLLYNAVSSGINRRLSLLRFAASDGKM